MRRIAWALLVLGFVLTLVAPKGSPLYDVGFWLFGILLVLFVLERVFRVFLYPAARDALDLVGLGDWACRIGMHDWMPIPVHTKIGLMEETRYYLAFRGVRIHYCVHCRKHDPPEGEKLHNEWRVGTVESVFFPKPKLK